MIKDLGEDINSWDYFLSHPCTDISVVTCDNCNHVLEYVVEDMSHYYNICENYYLKIGFIYKLLNHIPFLYKFTHEIRQQKELYYKIKCPNCNKDVTIIPGRKPTRMQQWYNYNKLKNEI